MKSYWLQVIVLLSALPLLARCTPADSGSAATPPAAASPLRLPTLTPLPPKRNGNGIVLVTLAGARADLTDGYMADGTMPALARLATLGVKATALQPVEPASGVAALTSMLTGVSAARTGIIADYFRKAGDPAGQSTRGFDVAPAVEPIWRSAMRFGDRTAVIGYPASGLGLAGQRADWMVSEGATLAAAAQFVLKFTDAKDWKNAPRSYSPLREAHMSVAQGAGAPPIDINVLAIDTTDDRQENYDTWLLSRNKTIDDSAVPLRLDEWDTFVVDPLLQSSVAFRVTDANPAHFAVYQTALMVNQIAPLEFAREITQRFGPPPAPADDDALQRNWIDAGMYVQMNERQAEWLTNVAGYVYRQQQPDVLLLRLMAVEDAQRMFLIQQSRQPGYAEHAAAYTAAVRRAYEAADSAVGELWSAIDANTTAMVVASPYGVAPAHTTVNLNRLLSDHKWLTLLRPGVLDLTKTKAYALADGGLAQIYLSLKGRESNGIVDTGDSDKLQGDIAAALRGLNDPVDGQPIFARVLRHPDLAALGILNDNSGDIVVQARPGFVMSDRLDRDAVLEPASALGASGYNASLAEMAGIFIAGGAGIAGGGHAGTASVLDVAPTIAALLHFTSPVFLEGRAIEGALK